MPWIDMHQSLSYVRDKAKKAFHAPTIKFQFEREQTTTVIMETKDEDGVPTGSVTEKSTYIKDCKVTLKTFAHSADEDGEHFIEAIEMLQKELEMEWTVASGAKANDATVIFQAVDQMLLHTANAEGMNTIGRYDKKNLTNATKNWEKFKTCVSDFITRAVFKPDACDRQKRCLQEHVETEPAYSLERWPSVSSAPMSRST